MSTRIVFMGSPEFSLPSLKQLAEHFSVAGVVTQPDRPAGRGRTLTPPPVKVLAQELDLPLIQPRRLKDPDAMQQLQDWQPEVIVVAAFGQILRSTVLDLPRHGCINVHASLLPRWRGAAPIQAAILHGDQQTGVSIMRMDPGIDTGPVYSQRAAPILPTDTAGSLSQRLAELGAALLVKSLPKILSGQIQAQTQNDAEATYASMLSKEEGELDFNQPAEALARRVRAFNPWPGAFTRWLGQVLKIHHARAEVQPAQKLAAGARTIYNGLPAIAAQDSLLILEEVQPAGKKPMGGAVFLNGARGWA